MGLISSGVGGVQMADVSVDTETGIVKMNKFVAVQDCGLIINPKTAESQIFGAAIMGICGALYEERIMDQQTGRMLNADMEFYKLAGIGDIGNIVVHLDITPEHDKRGVIGLGEPPAIGVIAAIGNAVANAIGVRVPHVPADPRPGAGRSRKEERVMQAFEYANPSTVQEAVALLGSKWGEADVLAGGTDLISLMKEYIATPKRVVNIKNIKELGGIRQSGRRRAHRRRGDHG